MVGWEEVGEVCRMVEQNEEGEVSHGHVVKQDKEGVSDGAVLWDQLLGTFGLPCIVPRGGMVGSGR